MQDGVHPSRCWCRHDTTLAGCLFAAARKVRQGNILSAVKEHAVNFSSGLQLRCSSGIAADTISMRLGISQVGIDVRRRR